MVIWAFAITRCLSSLLHLFVFCKLFTFLIIILWNYLANWKQTLQIRSLWGPWQQNPHLALIWQKTWPPWAILILFIAYINQVSGIGWEPLVLKQMCYIHLYHIFIAFIQDFIRMFILIVDLSLQKYLLCVYDIFSCF